MNIWQVVTTCYNSMFPFAWISTCCALFFSEMANVFQMTTWCNEIRINMLRSFPRNCSFKNRRSESRKRASERCQELDLTKVAFGDTDSTTDSWGHARIVSVLLFGEDPGMGAVRRLHISEMYCCRIRDIDLETISWRFSSTFTAAVFLNKSFPGSPTPGLNLKYLGIDVEASKLLIVQWLVHSSIRSVYSCFLASRVVQTWCNIICHLLPHTAI